MDTGHKKKIGAPSFFKKTNFDFSAHTTIVFCVIPQLSEEFDPYRPSGDVHIVEGRG